MFTADEVKQVLDAAFTLAESKINNFFFSYGLRFANNLIDASGLPQLIADELNKLLGAKGLLKK